jgi:2-polyprenyl-3-methyl-5-hydroxy-6-metoxy-1,4-benzoquinol methylase
VLIANTDKHWEEWGAQDPYFGVLNMDRFRFDSINETRTEFFESGEAFIRSLLGQRKSLVAHQESHIRALDFGCGVGRLSIPLARRFEQVVAIDISESMLREAEKNCTLAGLSNVTFLKSDDTMRALTGSFDFVVSYIVLQHIPRVRGYRIIDRLLASVRPGGRAMIHVSLRRQFNLVRRAIYFAKHRIPFAYRVSNVLQGKPSHTPVMQMNEYDCVRILEMFRRHSMIDIVVTPEIHGETIHGEIITARFDALRAE